jgi:hypothetical protein
MSFVIYDRFNGKGAEEIKELLLAGCSIFGIYYTSKSQKGRKVYVLQSTICNMGESDDSNIR